MKFLRLHPFNVKDLNGGADLSAAESVFNTIELLEKILLRVGNLNLQTLLLSQRTCRLFSQTIQGSILLQRRLYFVPELPREIPTGCYYVNPLLRELWTGRREFSLFLTHEGTRFGSDVHQDPSNLLDHEYTIPASWRRMLMFQPQAAGEISATINHGPKGIEWTKWWILTGMSFSAETRFGEAVDLVLAKLDEAQKRQVVHARMQEQAETERADLRRSRRRQRRWAWLRLWKFW